MSDNFWADVNKSELDALKRLNELSRYENERAEEIERLQAENAALRQELERNIKWSVASARA